MTTEELRSNIFFFELPKTVQESVLQSGTHFQTEAELRAFVKNLQNG